MIIMITMIIVIILIRLIVISAYNGWDVKSYDERNQTWKQITSDTKLKSKLYIYATRSPTRSIYTRVWVVYRRCVLAHLTKNNNKAGVV